MTTKAIMTLLGYMFVCSFTPGPGNILALNTTSKYGWKDSRRLILGICVGYLVVQALCTVALYGLNQVFASALRVLRYAGGAYMVWLAIHIMISRPQSGTSEKTPTFREGLLPQLVNVKIYFYITSLLTAYFIPNYPSVLGLSTAGLITAAIGSLASITWGFLGAKLQTLYNNYYRYINIVLGLFLFYCAWSIIQG